jgi:hypothetical protein
MYRIERYIDSATSAPQLNFASLQTLRRRRSMNDTFEDTGAVELTVLDDDALDNVTGGLLNRSFVAPPVANGGIPIGTPIALLFIAAALVFLPTIFGQASARHPSAGFPPDATG